MKAKEARARWQVEQLQLIEGRLRDATRSVRMAAMPGSPFGHGDEGLEDYRGITLATPVRYLSIERVDLSDAIFKDGASVNESEATECRFDRIDMRNVFVRRKFLSCSFVGSGSMARGWVVSSLAVTSRAPISPDHLLRTAGSLTARFLRRICQTSIS
jgi:hypothetical protein